MGGGRDVAVQLALRGVEAQLFRAAVGLAAGGGQEQLGPLCGVGHEVLSEVAALEEVADDYRALMAHWRAAPECVASCMQVGIGHLGWWLVVY